jgi:hypothetical protein
MTLDDLFGPYPGRPDHPDFARLVDVVLQQDGKTEDRDFDFPAYVATFIDPESLSYMVLQRCMKMMARNGVDPSENREMLAMICAAYHDAFLTGYTFHERKAEQDQK